MGEHPPPSPNAREERRAASAPNARVADRVLAVLDAPQTAAQVAQRLGVTQQTVSPALRRLEAQGQVARQRGEALGGCHPRQWVWTRTAAPSPEPVPLPSPCPVANPAPEPQPPLPRSALVARYAAVSDALGWALTYALAGEEGLARERLREVAEGAEALAGGPLVETSVVARWCCVRARRVQSAEARQVLVEVQAMLGGALPPGWGPMWGTARPNGEVG